MEDERIVRALNLLGENANLFSADGNDLLELIEDFFDSDTTNGKLQPKLLSHPAIIFISWRWIFITY